MGLEISLTAQQFSGVTTAFIPHPADSAKRVEFLRAKPNGTGPWPMLVFVHGHQVGPRVGGSVYATQGTLQRMAKRGIVAVAVSQPGYGQSDGPPDYAGPCTQAAIAAVIERMRNESYVMRDRVGLFGYSRGATAAAIVATRITDLRVLILGAGTYDLQARFDRLDRSIPQLAGIAANIELEAGTSAQAFRDRSVLQIAQKIKATTLLLHGAKDDRSPLNGTRELARQLNQGGTQVEVKIFPEAGHIIPSVDQEQAINAFLDRWLLSPE